MIWVFIFISIFILILIFTIFIFLCIFIFTFTFTFIFAFIFIFIIFIVALSVIVIVIFIFNIILILTFILILCFIFIFLSNFNIHPHLHLRRFPMEPLVGWPTLEGQEEGLQGVPSRRAWQDEWTKQDQKEAWERRFSKAGQGGGLRPATSRCGWSSMQEVVGKVRRDMEEPVSTFRTVKKRRACSTGSLPAELWTMLLHTSRNLSPGGQAIGYQRKKTEAVFALSLVERLLC